MPLGHALCGPGQMQAVPAPQPTAAELQHPIVMNPEAGTEMPATAAALVLATSVSSSCGSDTYHKGTAAG
jgi:hypothetical protein